MTTARRGTRPQGFGRTSRTYTVTTAAGTEAVYDSVTAILGVIAKPALVTWAANQERRVCLEAAAQLHEDLILNQIPMSKPGYIEALEQRMGKVRAHQKELDKAATIGSQLHARIEWDLLRTLGRESGPEPPLSDPALWAYMAYEDWRRAVDLVPISAERTVWSEEYGYAGTLDVEAEVTLPTHGRVRAILDWKTGKAIYPEALMQLGAYWYAVVSAPNPVDPAPHGVVIRLPKVETDPAFETRVLTPGELWRQFDGFLSAKRLWDVLETLKGDAPALPADAGAVGHPEPSTAVPSGLTAPILPSPAA